MKLAIDINCDKDTCGRCSHKKRHNTVDTEKHICTIFDQCLQKKNGDWGSELSFYRLEKCLQAEVQNEDIPD